MSQPATVTEAQIRQAQGGDTDAMWDVISAYEPVLKSVIRSVAPKADREGAEDLLQEARVALMESLRDYDSSGDASLLSYAYQAVRRAVADAHIKSTTALSIESFAAIRVRHALWTAGGDVEGAWLSVSTDADPRRRMSREAFVSVCEALAGADSLDARVPGGDDGTTWADVLPDTSADFVVKPTEGREIAHFLLREISPRQSYALRAYYGIGMMKTSDEQTSDELGLSSHRKCESLRKLRSHGVRRARIIADAYNIAA
ncbi:sigma-70 family RNA polymerase sigma factor [Streptomyces sp. NPDC056638]|uniref:sigma-70 family RNA polymerase sigma factor n=1 Tax=Streptomyces sp. NPDC056638 TaxID=3345887 RepID=UPI0036C8D8FD